MIHFWKLRARLAPEKWMVGRLPPFLLSVKPTCFQSVFRCFGFVCWFQGMFRYSSSHNHGSVEYGCISNISFLSGEFSTEPYYGRFRVFLFPKVKKNLSSTPRPTDWANGLAIGTSNSETCNSMEACHSCACKRRVVDKRRAT